jgi:superfamily II DNA helicase RecQ
LDRVVVDECHTLLEWTKTFRPQIGRLGEVLHEFGVPVVCLTATLKPTEEWQLFQTMGFQPGRVCVIRDRTTRRNIQYRVEVADQDSQRGRGARGGKRGGRKSIEDKRREEEDIIVRQVYEVVRTWVRENDRGKVIVYGGTVNRVRKISEELKCVGYWSDAGTSQDKARMMDDWV